MQVLKFDPSSVLELFAKLRAKRLVAEVSSKRPHRCCGLGSSQETMGGDARYVWAMIEVRVRLRVVGSFMYCTVEMKIHVSK